MTQEWLGWGKRQSRTHTPKKKSISSVTWTLLDSRCLGLLCFVIHLWFGTIDRLHKQSALQKVPANLPTPRTLQNSPCKPLKQTTSKQDPLGPTQKAACGFFVLPFCSCCVVSLLESCILMWLISVFPHCCQWFVDHPLTWHPYISAT